MTNDFAEIDINKEEYWDDEGAICPYCGFINKGDCENHEFYEDGDHIYTCDYCGEEFNMNTYLSYSYTTSRINEEKNNDR